MYDDNRKRQVRRVLFKTKIAVNGNEDIEIFCSSLKQLTICNARPTSLRGCYHVMLRQQASQSLGHTLVQQFLNLLLGNRGEVFKKLTQGFTALNVVEKGLDRYARSPKDGRPT